MEVKDVVVEAVEPKLSKEDLIAAAKEHGIELAEETAVVTIRKAFDLIEFLAPKVSLGLGMMVPSLRKIIEPPILALIDKIDGKDNPNY